MTRSCAAMVRGMHNYGLAHIDLFSWHVFVRVSDGGNEVVPIDLERTKLRKSWPLGSFFIRLKQLHDLAVLHLTTPWPQVSDPLRMLFYLEWLDAEKLTKFH